MTAIRIAVVGIGNCASSLVQGLEHYREGANDSVGLMHWEMGGYQPSDIKVVAAWDVDTPQGRQGRRRGDLRQAQLHRGIRRQCPPTGTVVRMGKILDGVAEHMTDYKDERTFIVANDAQPSKDDVVAELRETRAPTC